MISLLSNLRRVETSLKPMRHSVAAFAIIKCQQGDHMRWLAQWNKHWQCFNFVGGHKKTRESYRQCVIREAAEELNVVERRDYTVGDQPLARVEHVAFSRSAGEQTEYQVELFDLQLAEESIGRVEADPSNRWLTSDEIKSGQTADGLEVSETMRQLLTKAQLWPPDRTSVSNSADHSTSQHKDLP